MSDGTVKAKKKGSVKIYADIYTDDGEFMTIYNGQLP